MRTFAIVSVSVAVGLLAGCATDATGDASLATTTADGGTSGSGSSSGSSSTGSSSGSGSSSSSSTGSGSGGSSSSSTGSSSSGGSTSSSTGSGSGSSSGSSSSGSSSSGSSGGGSTSSSSGGGTAAVPTIGGCQMFPADNPWNTRVDDTTAYPVHPQSATYMANMSPGTHLHPDWGDWSTDQYGIPWQVVPATQAMVPMTFDSADESDPGPYPFPANAMVEGGANSGGDMHILVVQQGACQLYETWDTTYAGPGWNAGSGAKFDLTSNTLRPDGWTSADAAGLPILPGLVKVSEVNAGAINHAIRFTVANTQQGYIHPATHAAGSEQCVAPADGPAPAPQGELRHFELHRPDARHPHRDEAVRPHPRGQRQQLVHQRRQR